jgi:hypothetical protein
MVRVREFYRIARKDGGLLGSWVFFAWSARFDRLFACGVGLSLISVFGLFLIWLFGLSLN